MRLDGRKRLPGFTTLPKVARLLQWGDAARPGNE